MATRFSKLLHASRGALLDSWSRRAGSRGSELDPQWPRIASALMDIIARQWEFEGDLSMADLSMTPGTPCRELRDASSALADAAVGPGTLVAGLSQVFDVVEDFLVGLDGAPRRQLVDLKRLRVMRDVVTAWVLNVYDMRQADSELSRPSPPRPTSRTSRFDQLYSATTDIIMLTDADGMIRDANPEALIRFGGRLLGSPMAEVLGLGDEDLVVIGHNPSGSGVHEICVEFGNHRRHFGLRMLPRGADEGLMVLLNDITCLIDQREALEIEVARRTGDLARSEAMLESILESAGEGVLVVDDDLEIARANQRASEILGLPWPSLVGTPVGEFVAYADRPRLEALTHDLLAHEAREAELQGVYVDGREFSAAFTVNRFDHDGRRWYGILIRDISEQKHLEQRLRNERQQSEEMNVTLRNVLNTIESEREEADHLLSARIRDTILPALDKAQGQGRAEIRTSYMELVRSQLIGLTDGSAEPLDEELLRLSRTELEICRFVRSGVASKAIGEALNLSVETVQTHRKNIRRKLGLRGRGVNLHNYLQTKRALGSTGD